MALPSVTDWDFSYDELDLSSGEQVKTTTPLITLQNMDFSLRRSRLVVSSVFEPKPVTAGSYTTYWYQKLQGPNVLGSGASTDLAGAVKMWADDSVTSYDARITDATLGTLQLTVAAGASAQNEIWRGWMTGTFTAPGDGSEWTVTVTAQKSGVGNVYLAGVCLFL